MHWIYTSSVIESLSFFEDKYIKPTDFPYNSKPESKPELEYESEYESEF